MRKIEKEMLAALHGGYSWSKDNTQVQARLNHSYVFLHGNHLGTFMDGKFTPNIDTLRQWPSLTTKNRLRALGVNVTTIKGVTYLNGEKV